MLYKCIWLVRLKYRNCHTQCNGLCSIHILFLRSSNFLKGCEYPFQLKNKKYTKGHLKPLLKSMEVTTFSIVLVFCLKRELYVCSAACGCFVYENTAARLAEQRLSGSAGNSTVYFWPCKRNRKCFGFHCWYLKKFAYFAVTQDLSVPALQWENRWYNQFGNNFPSLSEKLKFQQFHFDFKKIMLRLSKYNCLATHQSAR